MELSSQENEHVCVSVVVSVKATVTVVLDPEAGADSGPAGPATLPIAGADDLLVA